MPLEFGTEALVHSLLFAVIIAALRNNALNFSSNHAAQAEQSTAQLTAFARQRERF